MRDHNHVSLIGRLAQNAELRYTNGGLAICKFSLAVNRRKKNGDEYVDEGNFFNATLFGTYGQKMQPHLLQGKQILLEGELRQHRWTTDDGKNRTAVTVAGDFVQFLRSPGDHQGGQSYTGGQQGRQNYSGQQQNPSGGAPSQAPAPSYDFEDDIPF